MRIWLSIPKWLGIGASCDGVGAIGGFVGDTAAEGSLERGLETGSAGAETAGSMGSAV